MGMKTKTLEVAISNGNVFEDLKRANPHTEELKALLATEIIKVLDSEELTVRAARTLTGIAAADFSRIRNADLGRFTVDRLMSIACRLGCRIDITVTGRRGMQWAEPVTQSISA
jgi:predicted XRE-type DNA-binding protein